MARRVSGSRAAAAQHSPNRIMTLQSKTKGKSTRKRHSPRRWIVDWNIEPASVPGHVSLSLFIAGESDDGVSSSATRHYLLQQDKLADFIRELSGTLGHSNASRALEETLPVDSRPPAGQDAMPDAADRDAAEHTNHFMLGAYGLVGN
jgi:hypothetical protein